MVWLIDTTTFLELSPRAGLKPITPYSLAGSVTEVVSSGPKYTETMFAKLKDDLHRLTEFLTCPSLRLRPVEYSLGFKLFH